MGNRREFDAPALREEVISFVAALARESERAAVVLGAARLDSALERLICRSMKPHPGGSDNLFGSDRTLSTFSAKIAIAHRLGLINGDVEHVLQLIRRIRNSFAHSIESERLSDSAHKNRLSEVSRACENVEMFQSFRRVLIDDDKQNAEVAVFCAAMAVLIVSLELSAHFASPPAVRFPATFNESDWAVDSELQPAVGIGALPKGG
jgi:hypothetical protein